MDPRAPGALAPSARPWPAGETRPPRLARSAMEALTRLILSERPLLRPPGVR